MSSVGRALLILQDLGRQAAPSSLSEIARRTGLAKSTVHRLLAVLESHQAVERQSGRYRPGPVPWVSGEGNAGQRDFLRRVAMPHLVTLFAQIDLSVSLAVLEDDTVIYLETLYGPGHSSAVLRTDTRAPAHCTAAGKLLLAYDPELVNRYGREVPLIALTPNTITTRIAFAAELTRIRAEGIAYNREEYVPGLIGAACPIMSGNQRPVATISIMGLAGGTDIMTVSDKLRRSAHAASVALRRVARAGH